MPRGTLSRRLCAAALALAAPLAAAPVAAQAVEPASPPTYRYLDLGPLGTTPGGVTYSQAAAVNGAGVAAGLATTSSRGYSFHATTWTGGVVRDLGAIDDGRYASSQAMDINDAGVVVGTTHVNYTDPPHAFVHRDGAMADLGTGYGAGSGSVAEGVNDVGVVVGRRYEAQGAPYRGVVWRDGEIVEIGSLGGTAGPWGTLSTATAVNNHGQVVGGAATPDGPLHGFLWQDGVLRDLGTLGGNSEATMANDINDRGQVVGMSQTAEGETHAFLWQDGGMRDLGSLGRELSIAYGVNEPGQVVGTVQSASDPLNDHAFVWYDGTMVDLNERVPGLPESVTLQSAQDVNDDGVIVGIACPIPCHLGGDEQRRGFLLTPVD
ncbi:DUF3466 family protein [Plantactinospora endophytica]|uniref:HAF repeat-containing protein n=1 Tax=Plantactinospora endophytica TaxID=673535 RepID=A0ABQ4DZJ1_9ACTN|nr:DUF3466 family protein [Plantactinospora endophytica]GIG87865.1 hypothetical protein Pen02_28010 [Plantactinospora endophytica]